MKKVFSILLFTFIALVLIYSCKPVEPGNDPPVVDPTPEPTPIVLTGPGTFSLNPAIQSVTIGETVTTDLYLDSGTAVAATYGVNLIYDPAVLDYTSVTAGADGFLSAVNDMDAGSLVISGFDVTGKGPAADLHMLAINFTAANVGTTDLAVTVNDLTDTAYVTIGTPQANSGSVTVIPGS